MLTEIYQKIAGKTNPNATVYINQQVTSDLSWFKVILPKAIGVHFVDQGRWDPEEVDINVWTDAALCGGMSFVFHQSAFIYEFLSDMSQSGHPDILFFEMFAIVSALAHFTSLPALLHRILFFSDSLNSVSLFDTLHASDSQHNAPLLAATSIVIQTGIDFHVSYIPGKNNVRVDMLFHLLYDDYAHQYPTDTIHYFSPPWGLLPDQWKSCF